MNSLPDENLKNVFAYLHQHPRGWTKKHYLYWCKSMDPRIAVEGHNCQLCYRSWTLSKVNKNTLRTLRAYHAACACGKCQAECLENGRTCDKNRILVPPQYSTFEDEYYNASLLWSISPIARWRIDLGMLTPMNRILARRML